VDAVGQGDGVADRRDAGPADVVGGDERDGGRRGADRFRSPRGERDVDVHELFDGQLLQIL
jgi:hypothetical protein